MKDAFLLFFRRENKQLQGHKRLSLWVTCGVFLVAILSAGFSVASMDYLQEKMSDPFVTCIDIPVDQLWSHGYEELDEFITKPSNQITLGYNSPENVYLLSERFQISPEKSVQLDGRTMSMTSPLKNTTILSGNNVIQQRIEPITDGDFGLILSEEGLEKLELHSHSPAFLRQIVDINDSTYCFSVPVLAIVKRLPNMCDFIVTHAYAQQEIAEGAHHFNLSYDQYNKELRIVTLDSQQEDIEKFIAQQSDIASIETKPYFGSWSNEYNMIIVKSDVENRQDYFNELFNSIQKKYPGAERIIDFTYDSNIANANRPQIVSCYFQRDSLEYKVEQFSTILDQETKYKIDMSKVENLKNLARVQQMGNTLSFCILLIVIVFISVFIYFLLNTHFQKIQRNLGTFKAFGVSESMIRRVYLLIIYNLIISSYMIAFAVSWGISFAVNTLVPITDDKGQYAIFDCIVWQNGALLLLTLLFATCTTILVVKKLLSHTPGDLIYNRNQD